MTLDEIRDTLREAAEQEEQVRFGHEIARTLFLALTELEDLRAAQPAADEPPAHTHEWIVLGWDRVGDEARVVQSCSCGDVREQKP